MSELFHVHVTLNRDGQQAKGWGLEAGFFLLLKKQVNMEKPFYLLCSVDKLPFSSFSLILLLNLQASLSLGRWKE